MARNKNDPRRTAAYTLVDLSELDDDVRKEIIADTEMGGGQFGVRVVEVAINGPAQAPIYGVYKDGPDAERWAEAKKEFGISSSKIDDAEVQAATGEITDPRRAAALREAAAQAVSAQADRIRAGEEAAVAEITGDRDGDATARGRTTGHDHPQNIVDAELATDAENEAADAENQEPAKATTRRSRNPR